jgi:REP element-mobilizing transposase RayT
MNDEKFRDRYRIPSARLATWDYSSNAAYFITICTQDSIHAFGEVQDGRVQLSPLGQAAWDCWRTIPDHFPFVIADAFVAMPNHVHGIIIIDKPDGAGGVETQNMATIVETQNLASLRHASPPVNQFGPQSQNLASIVRGFKIGVTVFARQFQIAFAWQARYHDHIIRNAGECDRIRNYIIENSAGWQEDRYHAA